MSHAMGREVVAKILSVKGDELFFRGEPHARYGDYGQARYHADRWNAAVSALVAENVREASRSCKVCGIPAQLCGACSLVAQEKAVREAVEEERKKAFSQRLEVD